MSAPGPFFGPSRPSAHVAPEQSPRRTRLTPRGDLVVASAVVAAVFLLMWAASALAYLVTGAAG